MKKKNKWPLDLRIQELEAIRDDFNNWRWDDTSREQIILAREAVRNIDMAIAHMKAFRALA